MGKLICLLSVVFFAQFTSAEMSVHEARDAACATAIRLGWQIQQSCFEDFGLPSKTTNSAYVFRNRILAPNCEARIIVPKDGSSITGYVDACDYPKPMCLATGEICESQYDVCCSDGQYCGISYMCR